jgi:uncharacterized membrane protein YhaH (DUF805 family)
LVYNLAAVHDLNTGIILTALTIAYLKCRSRKDHQVLALLALLVFVITLLPTPLHGTGIWGIAALLTTYAFFYRIWGIDKEITHLVLAALLFMMANIFLGFKLRGIF